MEDQGLTFYGSDEEKSQSSKHALQKVPNVEKKQMMIQKGRLKAFGNELIRKKRAEMRARGIEPLPLEGFL
jgi:hypothetical protein